jgi:UDP-glucose 4-epimerase
MGGTVLVTGGTGYIGSHTIVQLVENGWSVVIVDNLVNSTTVVLDRMAELTGKSEAVKFIQLDLREEADVKKLFADHSFDAVIHFAGYKSVRESKEDPLLYYSNNLKATIILLEAMKAAKVKRIVFSSSCTVYGSSPSPLTEESTVGIGITNAYARCKFDVEEMLRDIHDSPIDGHEWSICVLRYFNPVGAHPSGTIGEDPLGTPNCLMPFVLQVLVGRRPHLTLFGNDYPTRDGELQLGATSFKVMMSLQGRQTAIAIPRVPTVYTCLLSFLCRHCCP